mgnify:CR=1 FL=1
MHGDFWGGGIGVTSQEFHNGMTFCSSGPQLVCFSSQETFLSVIQRGHALSWTEDLCFFICLSFLCGFFFSFMSCSSVLLLSQQLSFLFFSRYQLCHFFQYLAQIIIPSNDLFFFQNIFSSDCGWYAYESNGGWTQTSQRSTEEEHIGVTLVPKPLHTGNPLISNPFTDVFAIH